MSIWGQDRDLSLFRHINRELLNKVINQQVGYYKLELTRTDSNIYGESTSKTFKDPVLLNCLIDRTDQATSTTEFGPDVTQNVNFRFLHDDLAGSSLSTENNNSQLIQGYNIIPEIGDVILWRDNYYETTALIENQFIVGKDPDYSYSDATDGFGQSWSIICNCHLTRAELVGLKRTRL